MRRIHSAGKKGLRSTLITAALLLLIGAGLLSVHAIDRREREKDLERSEDRLPAAAETKVYADGRWYTLRQDVRTYLIIGLDSFETRSDPEAYMNHQQADFLLLLAVDETAGSYSALQLNRDTMAEIQRLGLGGVPLNSFTGQLALSHTYGSGGKDSCRNTVLAVSSYLYGLPIEHYLSLTMDAVAELNDLLGGIEVYVEDDFSPIDPSLKQGETVRLQGKQALTFVRARGGLEDSSNLRRMARQRTYLESLRTAADEAMRRDDSFALRAVLALSDYLVSDCTAEQLAALGDSLMDCSFAGLRTIGGEAVKGEQFMEFYANEDELRAAVLELFYKAAEDPRT